MEIKINMFHTRHFAMKWSEFAQSCPTLCDLMDCSLLGSSVHGIFQARVLEWIAISFSKHFLYYRFIGNKSSQLSFIWKYLYFTLIVEGYFCWKWNSVLTIILFVSGFNDVILHLLTSTISDKNSAIYCVLALLCVTCHFPLDDFTICTSLTMIFLFHLTKMMV